MKDNNYNLVTDYEDYFLGPSKKSAGDKRFELYRKRQAKALDKASDEQYNKLLNGDTKEDEKESIDTALSATVFVPSEEEAELHDYLKHYVLSPEEVTSTPSSYRTTFRSSALKERATIAMRYLTSPTGANLSPSWAAALAGVLNSESGLIPGKENPLEASAYGNNGGKGIAQWSNTVSSDGTVTSDRRKRYEQAMADKAGTLEDELAYVMQEILQDRPQLYRYMLLHKDATIEEAVDIIHRWFENGGKNVAATKEQITAAYSPRWQKLGLGEYNFDQQQANRIGSAKLMFSLL